LAWRLQRLCAHGRFGRVLPLLLIALLAALAGRWMLLDSAGAQAQPLLWASTGAGLAWVLRRVAAAPAVSDADRAAAAGSAARASTAVAGAGLTGLALLMRVVPAMAGGLMLWPAAWRPSPGLAFTVAALHGLLLLGAAVLARRWHIDPCTPGWAAQRRWFATVLLLATALAAVDRMLGLAADVRAAVLAHALGLLLLTPLGCAWPGVRPSRDTADTTDAASVARRRDEVRLDGARQRAVVHSLGLGLTLWLALAVSLAQHQTRQATFAGQARALAADLQGLLQTAQRDLERLRDLHYRVDLDDEEFEQGGRVILRDSPWLRLFVVMPRVEAGQRAAFEASPWGLDGQAMRELTGSGGARVAAGERDHFPVRRVVPRQGSEALIGLDLAADTLLAPALQAAYTSGRTHASPPFASLARTASDAPSLLLFTPVPDRHWFMGEPLTPERVRTVIGAAVDLGWLLREARQRAGLDGVSITLEGGELPAAADVLLHADGRLLGLHDAARRTWRADHAGQPQARELLRLADRLVQLSVQAPWSAGLPLPGGAGLAVLAAGLAVTLLTSATLRTRQRHLAALQAAHDGLEQLVQLRTAALADSNRQLAAEVDERRRLEDDLRQASQQAHQANQAKTQFLANMSHEIRTPLNAVIGYTQILLEARDLPDIARERLRTILGAGQRLLRLINDVLDLSKIEAGGLQLHASAFDLRQECEEIVRLFADRARTRGLQLHAALDLEPREPVHGDRTKIGQIVMNLLSNAVKFTPQGGQVWLQVRRAGDGVAVEVRDDGPGIGPQELGQLFAPFRQGQAGLDQGGTGLGLALARHMARAMGGDLTLASTVGVGTTAGLQLPLPRVSAALPLPAVEADSGPRRLDPATPVHAVVVEDDAHSRDILVHLLTQLGCQVEAAPDGLAGLRLIEARRPDIVFTDIRMPVLDGLRMLGQLRAGSQPVARTPVIAVSASSLEHERRHYIEQGFNDFVGKPYPFSEIHRMLAEHAAARFIDDGPVDGPAAPSDATAAATAAATITADAVAPGSAGPSVPSPAQREALHQLRAAAADGQLRAVRQQLQAAAADPSALPETLLPALHQACQDYDVDALLRLIDDRLGLSSPPA
jgi:signal transduction histidine kinase/DNA-binding NarL/FixJ family response regulator